MRFHLVSLPHTQTTEAFTACAFTNKVRLFARMMVDLGHEVVLYSGDQNEAVCTEHVPCITEAQRLAHCGGRSFIEAVWEASTPGWMVFHANVIREMRARIQPQDFICVIGGRASKPIAEAFPEHMTVEFGIGYGGTFAKYRVWESYAWMHTCYGAATGGNPNAADGQWFDAVIPGYFEPEKFPYRNATSRVLTKPEDEYYLFMGRIIERKGYHIAAETCRRLGKRLVVAGQLQDPLPPDAEYVGMVGPEERGRLMAGAVATFVPTIYIEPFGNVAVESQACGTPVITTDWGAMTETVIEGVTGFHCRSLREFMDAAEKVKWLDPARIRSHAVRNYSLPVIAAKYERYFERLLTLWGDGWYAL